MNCIERPRIGQRDQSTAKAFRGGLARPVLCPQAIDLPFDFLRCPVDRCIHHRRGQPGSSGRYRRKPDPEERSRDPGCGRFQFVNGACVFRISCNSFGECRHETEKGLAEIIMPESIETDRRRLPFVLALMRPDPTHQKNTLSGYPSAVQSNDQGVSRRQRGWTSACPSRHGRASPHLRSLFRKN